MPYNPALDPGVFREFKYADRSQIPLKKREILFYLRHRGFTVTEISQVMRVNPYILNHLYELSIPINIIENNFQYTNFRNLTKYVNQILQLRDFLRRQDNKKKIDRLVQED